MRSNTTYSYIFKAIHKNSYVCIPVCTNLIKKNVFKNVVIVRKVFDKVCNFAIICLLMLDSMKVNATAKINIHLNVLPCRSDAYHGIESIFQRVSLYDSLDISKDNSDDICTVVCEGMELPEDNTLTKAYSVFKTVSGIQSGIRVFLTKRIPSGAGLGGGSSDAASLLLALNKMFDTGMSSNQLFDAAAKVGSDVMFFLSNGCAVVTGRGECVRNIAPRNDLYFVLVYPEVYCSTALAYSWVDEEIALGKTVKGPSLSELEEMYYKPVSDWCFVNSFSVPVMSRFKDVSNAFNDISAEGSVYTQMSGSGSSVFGVFMIKEEAETAYMKLSRKWKRCYLLTSS